MTETPGEQQETAAEQPEICPEEITSATEVWRSLVKTSKAFRMYLANNPVLHRLLEELKTKLGVHLDEYGEMKLDVDQCNLNYRGKAVYENAESRESLAFRIYADGIRSLIFTEGIEEREIKAFLEIIGTKSANERDDDIVTLLWIKELPHIVCILAEDYLEVDAAGIGPASATPQQDTVRDLSRAVPPAPKPVPAPVLTPQKIISPTAEEIACLKKAKEVDESRTALEEVVQVLSAILSVERDVAVFGDFAEITVNLIGNLIHAGNIDDALALVQLLQELSANETLSAAHQNGLAQALQGTISVDIIKDLEGVITATDKLSGETLREILLLFGRSNIKPVCELLGALPQVEAREIVRDVLVALGKETPEVFYPYLQNEQWQLVRDAIIILRRIASPASLEAVGALIVHEEPKIRKEVLLSLESFPEAQAKIRILEFLQDESSALRILAVKILAAAPCREALKPITEIVLSKNFDEKDLAEKKALFEALGELGADEAVPLLKEVLCRKYWFNKAREAEDVTLAVLGLKKVKTAAALKALEEGSARKKDEIKLIISRARRGMEMEKARVGAV